MFWLFSLLVIFESIGTTALLRGAVSMSLKGMLPKPHIHILPHNLHTKNAERYNCSEKGGRTAVPGNSAHSPACRVLLPGNSAHSPAYRVLLPGSTVSGPACRVGYRKFWYLPDPMSGIVTLAPNNSFSREDYISRSFLEGVV